MNIWDAISLTQFALTTYPAIRYIDSHEMPYLIITIGVILCSIFIKLTRMCHPYHPVMVRPDGARNCGILNGGGSYAGKIGFPSGHMLVVTYVLTCLVLLHPTPLKIGLSVAVIGLVGIARYYKQCHNIPQIVCGVLIGGLAAWTTAHFFTYY